MNGKASANGKPGDLPSVHKKIRAFGLKGDEYVGHFV